MEKSKCVEVAVGSGGAVAGGAITAAQIVAMLQGDVWELAEKMAAAMNAAKPGRIINDSEEPVRDAHADFRQQAYQKVVDLASRQAAEAFSPSASRERPRGDSVEEQGKTDGHAQDRQRRRRG